MIQYDGKYMHHAIAIPEGEGRYILNRLTGEIKTVCGPKMYLPDPRTEVVVKRKLSRKECELFYPGNQEVLAYNNQLTEQATERAAAKGLCTATTDFLNNVYSTADQASTLAIFEANANISRGTSYTKPRTITLDTKYEGVVSVDVWTGYAINVVSKNGKREIVVGPTTRLLDYDETLEAINLSTGEPKSERNIYSTAFLRVENNKISDLITVYTKDFVSVQLKVSYDVDFLNKYKEKWFSVENYVKHLCDKVRTVLKQEAQKYTIEEFYTNAIQIVRNVVLDLDEKTSTKDKPKGRFFPENGMLVKDVELLSVAVQTNVAKILETHQNDIVEKTLSLSEAAQKAEVTRQLAEYQQKEQQLNYEVRQQQLNLDAQFEKNKILAQNEINEKKRAAEAAKAQAEADLQNVLTAIEDAKNAREKANNEVTIDFQRKQAEIEKARQTSYAETVKQIVSAISPDLIAALTTKANADLLETATEHMSAYAIANGESVADTVNRLMRGTSLEGIIESATK
jgi:major vault protein